MDKTLTGLIAAGMLAAGMSMTSLAQDCPGRGKGKDCGGPPQSQAECEARQAACLEKNGGVCPNGGPSAECKGQGQGNGARIQGRNGLRDGTGPRNPNGVCPKGK